MFFLSLLPLSLKLQQSSIWGVTCALYYANDVISMLGLVRHRPRWMLLALLR